MLTPKDVSLLIGLGLNNTYKIFKLKGFPKFQIGKKFYVYESDLKKFFDEYKGSTIFIK